MTPAEQCCDGYCDREPVATYHYRFVPGVTRCCEQHVTVFEQWAGKVERDDD